MAGILAVRKVQQSDPAANAKEDARRSVHHIGQGPGGISGRILPRRDVVGRDGCALAVRLGEAELRAEIGEELGLARRDDTIDLRHPRREGVGEDLIPRAHATEVEIRQGRLFLRRCFDLGERIGLEARFLRGAHQTGHLDTLELTVDPSNGNDCEETLLGQVGHENELITKGDGLNALESRRFDRQNMTRRDAIRRVGKRVQRTRSLLRCKPSRLRGSAGTS